MVRKSSPLRGRTPKKTTNPNGGKEQREKISRIQRMPKARRLRQNRSNPSNWKSWRIKWESLILIWKGCKREGQSKEEGIQQMRQGEQGRIGKTGLPSSGCYVRARHAILVPMREEENLYLNPENFRGKSKAIKKNWIKRRSSYIGLEGLQQCLGKKGKIEGKRLIHAFRKG